ncbi:MAG: hypothetical protein FWC26_09840 [Fibromonadales bacterium]|nr:hypothetical protein [Fibromonadales bacterium]
MKYILLLASLSFAGALDYAYNAEYGSAFSEIDEKDSSACVLRGIALVTRFDDTGDTLDLDSALSVLKNCKTTTFWEPMRRYKIGLVHSILGNTFRSVMEARSAAVIFEKRTDIDSKAFYAIYAYYSPFSKFKQEDLKKGFEHSEMFSFVFGNSLVWILYEEKKYAEALDVANALLKRYPNHPTLLQTKAEMLFYNGKAKEAIAMFKESERYYAKRAPNSIRYWCAVAHLAKMTGDAVWKEKLKSAEYKAIKRWMPDIR